MEPGKDTLRLKADKYAHLAYAISKGFPKEELFGLTSQYRRASLSVPLNIIEGHARQSVRSNAQFLSIAYGSLQESLYLICFAVKEGYADVQQAEAAIQIGQEVARMLWSKMHTLKSQLQQT